jgi:EAL domain-containing protein (putative c-di-GMP-specific phosphodiesterase class I)
MATSTLPDTDLRVEVITLPVRAVRTDELLRAVETGSLVVHYQPVVDLSLGKVVAVEALLRWPHPELGMLVPGAFLHVAEEAGCVVPLGLWVLETACGQAARWSAEGMPVDVAVSLSARQLSDPGLGDAVRRILSETGLEPSRLLVEITEASLTEAAQVGAALEGLASLGVRLVIDRVGTGHSSLRHLERYPISALRIDATFVAGLGANRDDEAIVAGVASLAAAEGSRCIADGVETEQQSTHLVALQCQAQGQLFAPALPAAELPTALERIETTLHAKTTSARPRTRKSRPALDPGVADRMHRMHRDGASLQTIAAALNQDGLPHPKGTRWHARAVARHLSDALAAKRASSPR